MGNKEKLAEKRIRKEGIRGSLQFLKVIRISLLKKITFEQRLEEVSKVGSVGEEVSRGVAASTDAPDDTVLNIFKE